MTTWVFHHNDLDGLCSAAVYAQWAMGKKSDVRYEKVDYKASLYDYSIERCDDLIILDFSFPREEMADYSAICNMLWIDHHQSAIRNCEGLNIPGVRTEEHGSAAKLTWNWFFPAEKAPVAVELTSLWDTWEWVEQKVDTPRHFKLGMDNFLDESPDSCLWLHLLNDIDKVYSRVTEGQAIAAYIDAQCKRELAKGKIYKFHGVRCLAVNTDTSLSSDMSSAFTGEESYGYLVLYQRRADDTWRYSVRSTYPSHYDASVFCAHYGGGGHPGAGGFYSDELLFR